MTSASINIPRAATIIRATSSHKYNKTDNQRFTATQHNHLADINLKLQKISTAGNGHIPLITGHLLDKALIVSTTPATSYSFLCRPFTRIRENEQTAFLLATDDIHDEMKRANLRRIADLTIGYHTAEDIAGRRTQARVLDQLQNQKRLLGQQPNLKTDD